MMVKSVGGKTFAYFGPGIILVLLLFVSCVGKFPSLRMAFPLKYADKRNLDQEIPQFCAASNPRPASYLLVVVPNPIFSGCFQKALK